MATIVLRAVAAPAIAASLSISAAARATPERDTTRRVLSLHVSTHADVPAVFLQRAQREVLAIFERIGVAIEWIGCGLDRRSPDTVADALPVTIGVAVLTNAIRAADAISPGVLGAVVRDNDSSAGALVLFDRIERASDRFALDAGVVLGHAIAHEVGHLLLPRGAHGPAGLMRASWRMEDLRAAVHGQLGFNAAEATLIRARLVARK